MAASSSCWAAVTPVRRGEELGHRLAATLGLLVQPADGGRQRRQAHLPTFEPHRLGAHREQRRLADPVRTDDPDPMARRDDEVDVVEQAAVAA